MDVLAIVSCNGYNDITSNFIMRFESSLLLRPICGLLCMLAVSCIDPNLCDLSPCQNEGVCFDGLRSYTCLCQTGFYGSTCDRSKCPS